MCCLKPLSEPPSVKAVVGTSTALASHPFPEAGSPPCSCLSFQKESRQTDSHRDRPVQEHIWLIHRYIDAEREGYTATQVTDATHTDTRQTLSTRAQLRGRLLRVAQAALTLHRPSPVHPADSAVWRAVSPCAQTRLVPQNKHCHQEHGKLSKEFLRTRCAFTSCYYPERATCPQTCPHFGSLRNLQMRHWAGTEWKERCLASDSVHFPLAPLTPSVSV